MSNGLYGQVSLNGRPNSIRILQLSTDTTRPLEGQLKVVSLASSPAYYALSYTWGEPSNLPHQVHCHASGFSTPVSSNVEITPNCYDALNQLRRDLAPRGRPRSFDIWIDAICIDQNGEQEKLAQIPLMQTIYTKAQRVYIWLGPESEGSDYAMDWIREASLGRFPHYTVKFKNFPASVSPRELWKLARVAPELLKGAYHHLCPRSVTLDYNSQHTRNILLRSWFTRMWTVQELMMASEPIAVCGSKSMRWNSFFWGTQAAIEQERMKGTGASLHAFNSLIGVMGIWYDLYQKEVFSQPVIRIWANEISRPSISRWVTRLIDFLGKYSHYAWYGQIFIAIAIIMGRSLRGLRPFNTPWLLAVMSTMFLTLFFTPTGASEEWRERVREKLIRVLNMSRRRQASQPQDKVYALYGILTALDMNLQGLPPNTPFPEVYLDFTRRIMKWHGSIDMLREAGLPPAANGTALQNVPSWIPDWRWPLDPISQRKCEATKDSTPIFDFSTSGREVLTIGILIGSVDFVITIPGHSQGLDDDEDETLNVDSTSPIPENSITAICDWLQHIHRLEERNRNVSIEDAVFEVLNSATSRDLYDSPEFRHNFGQWYAMVNASYPPLVEPHPTARQISSDIASDEAVHRFHRRLLTSRANRSLFTTKKGYIGIGPRGMKMGDMVVLIQGFGLPMILNKKGGKKYAVVGVAHVHEMMNGEAWPSDEKRLSKLVLV